jgi:uncharacterized protein (TIGR03437 family)
MKVFVASACWALALGTAAFAQSPTISAVLDAAAYTPNIPQGGVFVVKGSNLATSSTSASVPYPTSIGGVSITFTAVADGTVVKANMVYTYSSGGITQLAGVLPASTATGNYNVTVSTGAGTSSSVSVTVVAREFGLITVSGSGTGRAVLQNVVSSTQYDLNRFTTGSIGGVTYSPAKPGQTLIAYGTGLNSTSPISVTVTVGSMQITAMGVAQGQFPGLDQINITLPANVPTGCNLLFQVSAGGQLSNPATVSIAPSPSADACVDPNYNQATLAKLDQPGGHITVGYFGLESFTSKVTVLGTTIDASTSGGSGFFAQYTGDLLGSAPVFTPTSGCQVYQYTTTVTGGQTGTNPGSPAGPSAVFLDAGAVTLSGPNVTNKAFTETQNLYTVNLGNPTLPASATNPILTSGAYTITGAGGKDVGPFKATVNLNNFLTITGGLPATIPRSQNLVIAWTGTTGSDLVLIDGTSYAVTSGSITKPPYTVSYAYFYCITTTDKGSFTVPSSILSQLPPTPSDTTLGFSSLSVYSTTLPTTSTGNGYFTAPLTAGGNIDYGLIFAGGGATATPVYQ